MAKRPVPTTAWIAERAKRADGERALETVRKAGTDGPLRAGDEVPEKL
jgi:hypothetical protein